MINCFGVGKIKFLRCLLIPPWGKTSLSTPYKNLLLYPPGKPPDPLTLQWCIGDRSHVRVNFISSHRLTSACIITTGISAREKNPYVDALPSEASRCLPVLTHFMSTIINKLLAQWPEHPVLAQLLVIIERVLAFSIHCPIMKFVHGLELLLEKAQVICIWIESNIMVV